MFKIRLPVLVISLVILFAGIIAWFLYLCWFNSRLGLMTQGVASYHFPYREYTVGELAKLFPQEIKNSALVKKTPEQTHQEFIAALKKQDFKQAVECCFREGDWSKMQAFLKQVKDNKKINLMLGDLEKIELDNINDYQATYNYQATFNGEKITNYLTFIKTTDGRWLIEEL